MNILVTGGNGQLGRSLNKISDRYPEHSFLFTDIPEADVTDRAAITRLVRAHGADVIVNCAAYTNVEKAEKEGADDALWINIEGAAALADVARSCGCALVHISTDYVFGNGFDSPISEKEQAMPLNIYGITKLAGEQKVLSLCPDAIVVRSAWLYSEFGSNFMKTMLRLSDSYPQVFVVDDQTGSPTYAEDLAMAIIQLVGLGVKGGDIYNFCNSGEVTWNGFTKEIFRIAGKTNEVVGITSADYPSIVRRPSYSVLDTSKISALGINVPCWQDALSRCMAEMKKL